MDLIYTDATGVDQGVIQDCSLDYEAGTDKDNCNFEIKTAINTPIKKGFFFYVEGEEYGGRIDEVKIETANDTLTATGRSWRGMLASKIVTPPENADYYIVSGDLKAILNKLITDFNLNDLFVVDDMSLSVKRYQFYRYTDMYSGVIKMLAANDLKLKLRYLRGKVHISAVAIQDFSNEKEITSDFFDFTITTSTPVNHVIGLGKGELAERLVVHKYLGADGKVTDTQYYTGADEIAVTYENADCEDEELPEKTEDRLKELAAKDTLDIKAYNLDADIGDRFEAGEKYSGLRIIQYVTGKIITISNQTTKIQYKVGKNV